MTQAKRKRPAPLGLADDTLLEDFPLGYHLITLTPQLAEHWLATYNTNNRPIMGRKVKDLATQMTIARWEDYHPHGISFLYDPENDDRLFLSDGQHRLTACVAANTPIVVWMYIDTPSARTVRAVIDKGAKRTTAENLGRSNHSMAVLKRMLFGLGKPPTGWTDADYRKMDLRFGWAVDFVVDNEPNLRGASGLRDSRVLGVIALSLLYGADRDRVRSFLAILQTGQTMALPENEIASALRDYLIVEIGRMLGEKGGTRHAVHTLAWFKTQTSLDKFLRRIPQKRLSHIQKECFPPLAPRLELETLHIDVSAGLVEHELAAKHTLV